MWHVWHIGDHYDMCELYDIYENHHICDVWPLWDRKYPDYKQKYKERMFFIRESASFFHGIMELGEKVTTNPNPTGNTELYSRERGNNFQDWRTCITKDWMREAGTMTRENSRQKKAENNIAEQSMKTRVRIVTDAIYVTSVTPMTFVTCVTFITFLAFIACLTFACHKRNMWCIWHMWHMWHLW